MEMEMEVGEEASVIALVARLSAAAGVLEDAAGRLAGREIALEAAAGREAELERLLAEANETIASLKSGRKTLPAGVPTLEMGALDAALGSLSLEQRIAVKSQLMRSGLIG